MSHSPTAAAIARSPSTVFRTALLVALAAVTLAACSTATPYQPRIGDSRYGFTNTQIEPDRFRVTFAGNSSTPRETVENYLLYRAAEVTLQQGYDWFQLTTDDVEAMVEYRTTSLGSAFPYYSCFGYGYPGRFGTGFQDATTRSIPRYSATAVISLGRGQKPDDIATAFDARSVLQNLGGFVVRPEGVPPAVTPTPRADGVSL